MCMMDEKWSLTIEEVSFTRSFKGVSKVSLVGKLKELLSSGLFQPSRGDLGELVCATYLLFCGDMLRSKNGNDYNTFSVPVSRWVELLNDPSEEKDSKEETERQDDSVCVNFIQFCRNDLRFGLADVCNESFLKYIYNSCSAVYAHKGCSLYNGYAAIKGTTNEGVDHYNPLIMSIRSWQEYTDGATKKNVDEIIQKLVLIKQFHGLVLLILLDKDDDAAEKDVTTAQQEATSTVKMSVNNENDAVEESKRERKNPPVRNRDSQSWQTLATQSATVPIDDCTTKIVSRIISIPSKDPFGITNLVQSVTGSLEESCIFASHAFLGVMAAASLKGCRPEEGVLMLFC